MTRLPALTLMKDPLDHVIKESLMEETQILITNDSSADELLVSKGF